MNHGRDSVSNGKVEFGVWLNQTLCRFWYLGKRAKYFWTDVRYCFFVEIFEIFLFLVYEKDEVSDNASTRNTALSCKIYSLLDSKRNTS